MVTSSTDPWHSASDVDRNYEHISFERIFAGGITNGQPMMVPVPVFYRTPEDAAALVRYLRTRAFPVERIEMGEEPEGQLAESETYASLYLQVAKAIKVVAPDIELGGPGYQTTLPEWVHRPDAKGEKSWTARFLSHLRDRGAMGDLDFFSFEWYPFDNVCPDHAKPLAQHPELLADLIRRQERHGLPADIPKVITEYGWSSFAGQVEVEMPGAMLNAEIAALFPPLGGENEFLLRARTELGRPGGRGQALRQLGQPHAAAVLRRVAGSAGRRLLRGAVGDQAVGPPQWRGALAVPRQERCAQRPEAATRVRVRCTETGQSARGAAAQQESGTADLRAARTDAGWRDRGGARPPGG
jgi:hypothetical protein